MDVVGWFPRWAFLALVAASATAGPLFSPRDGAGTPSSQVPLAAWQSLNASVNGRLFHASPVALPCYSTRNQQTNPDLSAAQCGKIVSNQTNADFLDAQFGAVFYTNWATCQATGAACPVPAPGLIAGLPISVKGDCAQGAVADYYIDVRQPQDVAAGLQFAQANGVPIVVKNSGHDYKGRSTGAGALSLWTHHLRPPMVYSESFMPDACSSAVADVITMGSGMGFREVYDFANAHGRDIVGGAHPTVGLAGGWLTGAGHSILSPSSGLGVDNAIQLRVVLANGSYVTANRCQNHDLFFALRGGGGGTFGVIMELTYATIPQRPLHTAVYGYFAFTPDITQRLLQIVVEQGELWAQQGWGGFVAPSISGSNGAVILATPNLNETEAAAALKPLDDFFANLLALKIPVARSRETVSSFYDVFLTLNPDEESGQYAGGGATLSSRLIPRRMLQTPEARANLTAALVTLAQQMTAAVQPNNSPLGREIPLLINIVGPTNFSLPASDAAGGAGEASITPAWRSSPWHVVALQEWDATETDPGFVQKQFQVVHDVMQPLRELTPDGGAYLNEADAFEPMWQQSFWGSHYARLEALKQELDPHGLLGSRQGVGWDGDHSGCMPVLASPQASRAAIPQDR